MERENIRNDIKEYMALHEETNDFYTKDLQDIVDLSATEPTRDQLFNIIVTALKAGYARGYRHAQNANA